MIQHFIDWFSWTQGWLFESLVEPFLYHVGLAEYTEDAFEGVEWFLTGVCELAALYLVLRPLEALFPAQKLGSRYARVNDFIYTAIHRLGLFSVAVFFTLDPLLDRVAGLLRLEGVHPFNLESLLPAMSPAVSFLLYLVVLDFFEYWLHRGQHHFNWWWGLHSLHHSQRDMNLWSDNRNHLLDDLLRDVYMAAIALAIGVAPGQFVLLVSLSRALQSLQHANLRLHFGWFEPLLVSPRFHRHHHAIGTGHESAGQGTLGGCNFAVLLPVWDILFGTAQFVAGFPATGVRDQLPGVDAGGHTLPGRDYGRGFWRQQWRGLVHMVEFSRRRKPG